MTRLEWDSIFERDVKYGVEKGVLYPKNSPGVVWNGLISVEEAPEGADVVVGYFDGQAYYRERSSEGFAATVSAFTYPESLYAREPFGFTYKTGDELHLVYNAMASTTGRTYPSLSKDQEPTVFSWNLVTTPVKIPGYKATSHLIIDLMRSYPHVVQSIEDLLYGTETTDARLPSIEEFLEIFENGSHLIITDHGDGTWTASGPDAYVHMEDADSFVINSPSVVYLDDHTYMVSSW